MVDIGREPLASVDLAWLRMDEPGNLMVINGVMMLEEPVPFERYRDLVASRVLALPRLRQRVAKPARRFGGLAWEPDPAFDLAHHFRLAPLEAPDQASLQDLVGRLMSEPLDPRRPLWQFHFVPRYESGCAVICRFHHCIGDGLALLYVLLMLTDEPPAGPIEEAAGDPPAAGSAFDFVKRPFSPLVSFTRTVEEGVVREAKEIIARPARALDVTRDLSISAGAAGKILLMSSDPATVFKGPLSEEKRAVWSRPIPVDTLKEVARVTGSKINDVVLAAVAGGLRSYLLARGQPVAGLDLRAVVPVNLRPMEEASELGNRFGLVFVPLPIGIEDPLDRIFAVRHRTQGIKRSPEALLTFQILRMLGVTPSPLFETVVGLFGRRSTAVMTNVIGPREPLLMAGTRLKQVMFWVPCSGRLGMGVSIFSYAGNLWVGIATDARLVPDPQRIVEGFHADMATLMNLSAQVHTESPPPAHVS
jgi:WS/DGAT/MGAT family acyltransferase